MKTTYREFELESRLAGSRESNWGSRNHNIVKVTNKDTGEWIEFDYWGSEAAPVIEGRENLLSAFNDYISDGMSGEYEFSEFIWEYGYSSTEGKKIHIECIEARDQLREIYEGDIYDLYNDLNEELN